MAAKYGLAQPELGSRVNWGFLDFMFAIEYDIVLALGKIRRAGFTRHPDTLEGFLKRFDEYRRARIIPTFEFRGNGNGVMDAGLSGSRARPWPPPSSSARPAGGRPGP